MGKESRQASIGIGIGVGILTGGIRRRDFVPDLGVDILLKILMRVADSVITWCTTGTGRDGTTRALGYVH